MSSNSRWFLDTQHSSSFKAEHEKNSCFILLKKVVNNKCKLESQPSSLYLLFHNFLKFYPYKILVFHDAPLLKEEIIKSYNSKFKTQYYNSNESTLVILQRAYPDYSYCFLASKYISSTENAKCFILSQTGLRLLYFVSDKV